MVPCGPSGVLGGPQKISVKDKRKKAQQNDLCSPARCCLEGGSKVLCILFLWLSSDSRNQLVSTDSCSDSIVSYGVRNSIAAYLSLSEDQDHPRTRTKDRKRKCKTVYSFPEHNLENSDI